MSNLQIKPIRSKEPIGKMQTGDTVRFCAYGSEIERVGVFTSIEDSDNIYITEIDPCLGGSWRYRDDGGPCNIDIIEVIRNSEITFTVE